MDPQCHHLQILLAKNVGRHPQMGELVPSDSCVDTYAVHTYFVFDNVWYIHLPQSCPGILESVMCVLANVV